MSLIQLVEVLVVVGVLLWLVNRFIPMQGTIKSILNGVVVIAVVLWLLNAFGMFHSLSRIHVGSRRRMTVEISLKAERTNTRFDKQRNMADICRKETL